MFLYLVRHGEAKNKGEDPERGLTDKGAENVRKTSLYAARLGVRVVEIFHSSKPRAQQTAKILAEHLKPEKGIDQTDNLLPDDDPGLWALRLAGMNEDVMLVGHLPFMERMAGLLLTGDKDGQLLDFKPGGIACLKRKEGRWVLEWMLAPEVAG